MILELQVPLLNPNMSQVVIETLHQQAASELRPGDKLFDLSLTLGANFVQDCPPISYFRLVARERAWLRRLLVTEGTQCQVNSPLALFSTAPDEALDASPVRALRCASANIMFSPAMFSSRSS